jgi:hypothetical protein
MPEPSIVLDQDQADDLRELLTLTAIVQEWLEYADDGILDDLARFAYRQSFHPRSAVQWLTEDLAGIPGRLRTATTSPQAATTSHDQDRVPAPSKPSPKIATPSGISSGEGLDTPAPIGNQILPPLPSKRRSGPDRRRRRSGLLIVCPRLAREIEPPERDPLRQRWHETASD